MLDLEIADRPEVASDTNAVANLRRLEAAVVLLPVRLFLAAGWMRAAVEKLIDPDWWNGQAITKFVSDQHDDALPFFTPFLDNIVLPNAMAISVIIVLSQLLVAVAIGVGRHLRPALRLGIAMNVVFVLSGRVDPSAFYLVMEAALLYGISAGWLGERSERTAIPPLVASAGWTLLALSLSRWIETIEPAAVIDDPAMVLAFTCGIMAFTSLVTWVTRVNSIARVNGGTPSRIIRSWLLCRSETNPPS